MSRGPEIVKELSAMVETRDKRIAELEGALVRSQESFKASEVQYDAALRERDEARAREAFCPDKHETVALMAERDRFKAELATMSEACKAAEDSEDALVKRALAAESALSLAREELADRRDALRKETGVANNACARADSADAEVSRLTARLATAEITLRDSLDTLEGVGVFATGRIKGIINDTCERIFSSLPPKP